MQKQLVEKVANGALVIEKAGKLSNEGCEKLADALNQEHTGIIVFVLDENGRSTVYIRKTED